jgi:hypothetical protein
MAYRICMRSRVSRELQQHTGLERAMKSSMTLRRDCFQNTFCYHMGCGISRKIRSVLDCTRLDAFPKNY